MKLLKQQKTIEIEIEGKKVKLSHLDKVFWPDEGYTKRDLINYYIKISNYLLPYLKDRPESLLRLPNGITGKRFFQKDIDDLPPSWTQTINIFSEGKNVNYLICQDLPSLLFMINLGVVDINPWNSRIGKLDHPDYLIIDLDPEEIDFSYVVEAALAVKEVLDGLNIPSYPKTSGARGMHIYIPMGAKYNYDQSRNFAEIIVNLAYQKVPSFTSLERSPKNRQNKVYLDHLQNSRGQTLASPYCLRPRAEATVSAPLLWKEVNENLDPKQFTIKTIFKRLDKVGDVFKGTLGKGIDLKSTINKIKQG